jgi:hypothetical protein
MALHIGDGLHMRFLGGDGDVHISFPAKAIKPDMVPKARISSTGILDHSTAIG